MLQSHAQAAQGVTQLSVNTWTGQAARLRLDTATAWVGMQLATIRHVVQRRWLTVSWQGQPQVTAVAMASRAGAAGGTMRSTLATAVSSGCSRCTLQWPVAVLETQVTRSSGAMTGGLPGACKHSTRLQL